ncbi:acetoacetate decarboxylase family protein [Streptosporangium minutum]|uniref:Acetoacetate decarboxylase n=1 Tax=Streptosporangium minutum TaxID=569862 RepID=A0A243QSX0_9ACTN|nr:acetoacetate decarboxylase family protein [Streptosporangium minutum]OUC84350.1 acetoacetate decarboxylase [Streptosporangium minutum]
MARHLIQGREIAMPVRIRDASVCSASYLVRADAARAVIAYSGLDVAEVLPGKALCTLVFVDYADGDLDAYREFGVAFLIRPPGEGPPPPRGLRAGLSELRRSGAGAFIHWLPVDQGFTLEAGRTIWGFPKELADIDLRLSSPYKRCILRKDGRLVLDLLVKPGAPVPAGGTMAPVDAYSHLDGVTRRIPWSMSPHGVRMRPGGALIRLGNHPVAKELSELGLPKLALMTSTVSHLTMAFGEAKEL